MDHLALFGTPITHSLSPYIHQSFAQELGITICYETIDTQPEQLALQLKRFRSHGGIGANITAPLKQEAYALSQRLTPRAEQAQAVNTLGWDEQELWGDNTDGEGLSCDLIQNQSLDLKNKRILILGAGGAVQGILGSLLGLEPATIELVNRDLNKAQQLAQQDLRLKANSYEGLMLKPAAFDLVINATSASLSKELPALPVSIIKNSIVMDLAYQQQEDTIFLQWAKAHGAKQTFDGIGMLVEQAALSFECWYHYLPATQSLISQLRQN